MAKMSRRKKLVRVAKRKLLKPVLYAAGMSFVLYLAISNVVLQKKVFEDQVPRFLITRISRTFDETEFMHLLLTVQEIMKMPTASAELEEFANGAFPSPCPRFLEQQLKRMNWEPQAFLVRVKSCLKCMTFMTAWRGWMKRLRFYLRKSTSGGCRLR